MAEDDCATEISGSVAVRSTPSPLPVDIPSANSHELSNTLMAVEACTRRPVQSLGEAQALLEEIQHLCHEAIDSVNRRRRSLPPPPAPAQQEDGAGLLRRIIAPLHHLAADANVTLAIGIDSQLHLPMAEDPLRSVIFNLVKNAIEASPDGGRVKVQASNASRGFVLTVTDRGCGMDQETLSRSRSPYFTTKDDGSGVGLPLVEEIVNAHGGRLELTSALGAGTQALVTFEGLRRKDSGVTRRG